MNNHIYVIVSEILSYGKLTNYHIVTSFANIEDAKAYKKRVEECQKTTKCSSNERLTMHDKAYFTRLRIVDVIFES